MQVFTVRSKAYEWSTTISTRHQNLKKDLKLKQKQKETDKQKKSEKTV